MSMVIAALMFIPLLAVSLAHLLWSFGLTWPIRNEQLLAQTVAGFQDITKMPPRYMSFLVAILVFAAGIIALALADDESGGITLTALGILCALVFLGRGVAGYTQRWIQLTPHLIFRYNDSRIYSPLCLALGAGFAALVIMRLI